MTVTIVTGASSGLGRELFCSAVSRVSSDEYWLIARRRDELEKTAALCPRAKCRVLPLDLSDPNVPKAIALALEQMDATVDLLINNAGFGVLGDVATAEPDRLTGMLDVNVRALTALTRAVLPRMKEGSGIINVASIAAFAPNPRLTVYSASKAYVYAFSKGLREETLPLGINVLAVCPGPMDTGFLPTAGISDDSAPAFTRLPYCDPKKVAEAAVKRVLEGKSVAVVGALYKLYRIVAKILPHSWVMKFSKL